MQDHSGSTIGLKGNGCLQLFADRPNEPHTGRLCVFKDEAFRQAATIVANAKRKRRASLLGSDIDPVFLWPPGAKECVLPAIAYSLVDDHRDPGSALAGYHEIVHIDF